MKIGDEERLKSLAFVPIDDLDKIEFHPPIGHIVKNLLKSGIVEEMISANRHLGNFWKNFPTL